MGIPLDDTALLFHLADAPGPPGFEDEVRERILALARPLADRVETDPLGSVIAWLDGPDARTVLIDAHMDEVGFIANHVERGFLRFEALGGWDARILPGMMLRVRAQDGRWLRGVVGTTPPHVLKGDGNSVVPIEDSYIDIGCSSDAEAAALGIGLGAPIVPATEASVLLGDRLIGKAFDDRAGCAASLRLLERFAAVPRGSRPARLAFAYSVCEEVGFRGAEATAFRAAPAVALCLEGTVAADGPGASERSSPTILGKGPAITIADKGAIYHPALVRALVETAGRASLPWQYKRPAYGRTDGSVVQTSRAGVATACVSVPCRYIHSAHAILSLADFRAAIELSFRFLQGIGAFIGA